MGNQQISLLKAQIEQIMNFLDNTNGESLNHLDVALLKNYLLKAYEITQTLPQKTQFPSQIIANAEIVEVQQPVQAATPVTPTTSSQIKESIQPENIIAPVSSTSTQNKPQSIQSQAEQKENLQSSLFDVLNSRSGPDNSMVEKMKKQGITNLKSAIGINEKYIFLYELFEGNVSEYNKIIDQLNQIGGKSEAINFIETELRTKFDWSKNPKAEAMFLEIIERRFS